MESFTFTASDGHNVAAYAWLPPDPIGVVQIAHGMGEHAQRYDWVATQLNEQGYAVYASDHRGHGATSDGTLGYMGPDGWNRTLADMYELNQLCKQRHPSLRLCLLGHSMGAMLSQQYMTRYGHSVDAVALSGSPGFKESRFGFINQWILSFERWRQGPDGTSALMQQALFGKSNDPFDAPGATGSEWLSRDAEQVAAYVADPLCGFVLTPGSLMDMYHGLAASKDPLGIDRIPGKLPVYVFSGSEDPVHGEQQDINRLVSAYRKRGLSQLTYKLYPGGRHEVFNETNKEEVMQDLIDWLALHLKE